MRAAPTEMDGSAVRSAADGRRLLRLAMAFALVGVVALVVAEWMRPTEYLARTRPAIQLALQVPQSFGSWREANFLVPVLPNPETQARLDALYSQILARTYVDPQGRIVMLSIAYGSDQGSEATAVHRPEFCYTAQGFEVTAGARRSVPLTAGKSIQVQRLSTVQGDRHEPVMYWVTLDDEATLPGIGRKLAQLRFGLQGQIADGMLVRVSSLHHGASEADEFALQERFLRDLFAALPADIRSRYFGR